MTIGQLTALAIGVLGLGVYSSVRGFIVHIKLRKALQDRKNKKLPKEKTISILMMLVWTAAIYLEDQLLHKLDLPVPELFEQAGKGVSVGMLIALVLLVFNHFKPSSIKRDERMLFIETGFLIIMTYLILSPAIMMIYLRVTVA